MLLSEQKCNRLTRVLFILILLTGIYLRCYQYLMGRSLWEDEAHLALNFITRGYLALLKPLDYIQAAPPLFLLTVKTFTVFFGNNIYALRALPFLASVLTLPLFYYILLALTRSRLAALTGFFVFSVNLAVLYYSSELKTYELDVAIYLLMVYLVLSEHKWVRSRRNLLLGIAGCISMLYSNTAPVILFSVAGYFLLGWYRHRKIQPAELKVLIAWTVVLGLYFFGFVYHHPYAAIQKENYAFAFPPLPLFGPAFNHFMAGSLHEIGFTLLLYVSESWGFAYVLLSLFLVALFYALYSKQYTLLLFTCLPVLLHFTLSLFKVYPFWYRLILYIVPPLIVLMSYGAVLVARFVATRLRATWITGGAILLICCYFFTAPSLRGFPLYYREIKPVLDHMNKNYPRSYLYITTPYTLYKYYQLTGYVQDSLYEGLPWNIGPAEYYEAVSGAPGPGYLLLHATDPGVDGYKSIMDDLRAKKLVLNEFSYGSYTLSEIKALPGKGRSIGYSSFDKKYTFDLNGKKVVALWDNQAVKSDPVQLDKGSYAVTVVAQGTAVKKVFPHIHVRVNGKETFDFYTPGNWDSQSFLLEQANAGQVVLEFAMDNDASDQDHKEDRNAFLQKIVFEKR